jgi:hypothetical protein
MTKSVIELSNLSDVASYWRNCLAMLDSTEEAKVAGYMACVISNDHFDEWYQESENLFANLFDLAAELELPDTRTTIAGSRADAWKRIQQLLKQFEIEYPAHA